MLLNFAEVLREAGPGAAFRIARSARASSAYLLNSVLPDTEKFSYSVEGGTMTVRPTMPGLVGMDSPYPTAGAIDASSFLEKSAKIAHRVPMSEQALRHLQDMMMRLGLSGAASNERLLEEALNFLQAVIIQPHLDIREYLKGQALAYGQIDWTFNKKNLLVNYGVPAGNFFPARTGNDAYGGSESKFWEDVRLIRRALRGYSTVRILAHPDTVDVAQYNPANAMATIAETDSTVTFRRYVEGADGPTAGVFSSDARDAVELIKYGLEGEIVNPADPSTTLTLPFLDRGKLVGVGIGRRQQGYVVGRGSQDEDPDAAIAIGYGHVAPTVEGGGAPGLWADLYTPENEPWSLVGRAAQNFLPVIEDEQAVAVATTELS